MTAQKNIYQEVLLRHWRFPQNFGKIHKPTKSVVSYNAVCGDKIQMDVVLEKDRLKAIKFSGQGCVISMACASLLTEYVKGKRITSMKKIDRDFILKMLGIQISPSRLKCALLPLETLHKVIS